MPRRRRDKKSKKAAPQPQAGAPAQDDAARGEGEPQADHPFAEFTLVEHLEELRWRLLYSFLAILVVSIAAYTRIDDIERIITGPYYDLTKKKLMVIGPMDAFLANIKIALVSGLVMSSPFWMFQGWKFIAPGLHGHERKFGVTWVPIASLLFAGGCAFGHLLVAPMALQFFVAQGVGFETTFTLEKYMAFILNFVLSFGAAFEMPVVLVALVSLGVVPPQKISKQRGMVYLVLAVLAAVLTPPDVISMGLLFGPLVALFEGSLLVIRVFRIGRRHWNKAA